METLKNYKTCIKCNCRYITYEKYENAMKEWYQKKPKWEENYGIPTK